MPRLPRIVIPGVAHHVVQRGNNRQDVFFVDDDCRAYLTLLKTQGETYGLRVLAYCLMTNHVHLVAVPEGKDSLAKAVGRADYLYTQYVNRRHGRSGHLWQNRFYSCALDEDHFFLAIRYVEQNPLRAGMVKEAVSHPWSSAAAHAGVEGPNDLLDLTRWGEMMKPSVWRKALQRQPPQAEVKRLRTSTARGWPLAGERSLAKLEKLFNRRLHPLKPGRPRGTGDAHPRTRHRKQGNNR